MEAREDSRAFSVSIWILLMSYPPQGHSWLTSGREGKSFPSKFWTESTHFDVFIKNVFFFAFVVQSVKEHFLPPL